MAFLKKTTRGRTVLRVCGESGMGLRSVGFILTNALKRMGHYVYSDREYPSLIQGGFSNVQIDFSLEPVRSLSTKVDIMVALDFPGLVNHVDEMPKGSTVLHTFERYNEVPGLLKNAKRRGVQLLYIPAKKIAHAQGGNDIVINMVMLGYLWGALNLPMKPLEDAVRKQFADKPKILAIDLKCIEAGAQLGRTDDRVALRPPVPKTVPKTISLDGNMALALGAIQCGVRAYYAYPMSPASTLLTYLADRAKQTGMVVKQAEDEITAAQMATGSMFMGTRALTATSGGGFDLMTETVSLAAMTETPLVIAIAQRPGPATGLPTWTAQTDLNLAIHAGHGEFPRVVLSCSDVSSCYEMIQHAMNLAETYQLVVILLTDKTIAEAQEMVAPFEHKKIPIQRGLITDKRALAQLTSTDRFKFTPSGVSPRWLPGSCKTIYYANSDEHGENGVLTEKADVTTAMIDKRMRKLDTVARVLPEPKVYGTPKGAAVSVVGWGSTKGVMLDAIRHFEQHGVRINYLHYEYMWPLKTKRLQQFFKENTNVRLIEGNQGGQLGQLITGATGLKFKNRFLKYDGRCFFFDEVVATLSKSLKR